MVSRLTSEQRAELVGKDAETLLANRHMGGGNGTKGSLYEQFFAVHRLTRLSRKWLELQEDALVEWQADGFIDDIVVRRDPRNSFKAFQLKNSPTVSWTAGEHSIQEDFALQHTVSSAEGYEDIRLRLVCSDEGRAGKLAASVPENISAYSSAFFFPFHESPRLTLLECGWVADDFAYLSRHDDPDPIEIANVASVIMGAWALAPSIVKVSDVIDKARSTSPTIIRTLVPERPIEQLLLPETSLILGRIPNFQYAVIRGFLRWSAGRDTGTLSFDCYSSDFATWQATLAQSNPTTFEQIERMLT
jgi:hypothetical protein